MRFLINVAATAALFWSSVANAQGLGDACLQSGSSQDVTAYCLKASYLLQRAQLQSLEELRGAIERLTARSVQAINQNGANTLQALGSVSTLLQAANSSMQNAIFIDDLTGAGNTLFDCPTGDCAAPADVIARQICRTLGFSEQHAHDFERNPEPGRMMRMRWVACRP